MGLVQKPGVQTKASSRMLSMFSTTAAQPVVDTSALVDKESKSDNVAKDVDSGQKRDAGCESSGKCCKRGNSNCRTMVTPPHPTFDQACHCASWTCARSLCGGAGTRRRPHVRSSLTNHRPHLACAPCHLRSDEVRPHCLQQRPRQDARDGGFREREGGRAQVGPRVKSRVGNKSLNALCMSANCLAWRARLRCDLRLC